MLPCLWMAGAALGTKDQALHSRTRYHSLSAVLSTGVSRSCQEAPHLSGTIRECGPFGELLAHPPVSMGCFGCWIRLDTAAVGQIRLHSCCKQDLQYSQGCHPSFQIWHSFISIFLCEGEQKSEHKVTLVSHGRGCTGTMAMFLLCADAKRFQKRNFDHHQHTALDISSRRVYKWMLPSCSCQVT